MGKPAARVGDVHVCPMVTGTVPHVGGPIMPPGAPTVLVGGVPAATLGDMAICTGPPDSIILGSMGVMVGGKPAARVGDMCAHGGTIVVGLPTVLIGDFDAAAFDALIENIAIDGDALFTVKVTLDLRAIASTPTGKALLESIKKSGKTVAIELQTMEGAGNSCTWHPVAAGGTDSTIYYLPDRTRIGGQPWETRPPAIGLSHELIHADQVANGTMAGSNLVNDDNRPDGHGGTLQVPQREVEAVGVAPHDNRDFTENKIRNQWDPQQPQRQWY